ncbi:MAG TPA: hypothetical protein VMD30_03095 [Tepidisphaeraceae bacterium]|nr:hypothetical protein [Tepidisphaeraceae bacterium]
MIRTLARIVVLMLLAGCASTLDTGYQPNKLGSMTPDQRRALYAPQFSSESEAAPPAEPSQFHRADQGY